MSLLTWPGLDYILMTKGGVGEKRTRDILQPGVRVTVEYSKEVGKPPVSASIVRVYEETIRSSAPTISASRASNIAGGRMDGLWLDLHHAARGLRRAPGFTALAIATLALGIGANGAIFSLVQAVMLRPLSFPTPEQIVVPISTQSTRGIRDGGDSYADYLDWRQQRDLFEAVALWRPLNLDLTGGDRAERVGALAVTGEYFAALGAKTSIGRTFDASAEAPGERPLVLSDAAWRRILGEDRNVIGRTVFLSGTPYTIAGVLAPGNVWPIEMDAFVPLRLDPARDPSLLRRDNFVFRAIARTRPGVSIQQTQARVKALAAAVESEAPNRKGWSYDVVDLRQYTVGDDFPRQVLMLWAAVGLVLLLVCANVANLLLVRGTGRRREISLRIALGASRHRVARALFAEAALMATAGTALGLVLGYWISRALLTIAPQDQRLLTPLGMDWQTVAFAAAAVVLTAALFGVLPALQAAVVDPHVSLKEGGRTSSTPRSGLVRDAIVATEVALAVVLLVSAALLTRSLIALGRADTGVDVRHVLAARIVVPGSRYPQPSQRVQFYRSMVERVSALPGVRSAALTSRMPAGGPGFGLGRVFLREGQPEPPASADAPAQWTVVTPDYFRTLSMRLVAGRLFTSHDDEGSTPVILVSERLARTLFPNGDAIGKRIRSWRDENVYREIVGIVNDVRYFGLSDTPRSAVYVPHAQDAWGTMMLAVKTENDPMAIVADLRRTLTALDPLLALGAAGTRDLGTLERFASESVSETRFTANLLGGFAVLALVLAAVGVYGVMSYVVSRRVHEMGVRIALGARPRHVAALVVGRGLTLASVGVVVGLGGAAAAARALRSAVHEIGAADPWSFAVAPLLLLFVAAAACLLPARRASRIDPIDALRQE